MIVTCNQRTRVDHALSPPLLLKNLVHITRDGGGTTGVGRDGWG